MTLYTVCIALPPSVVAVPLHGRLRDDLRAGLAQVHLFFGHHSPERATARPTLAAAACRRACPSGRRAADRRLQVLNALAEHSANGKASTGQRGRTSCSERRHSLDGVLLIANLQSNHLDLTAKLCILRVQLVNA